MSEESIEEWIRRLGVKRRLIRAPVETATVDDAARFLGVDKSRIVKTLIVTACSRVYAAIIPGDKKLDLEKLASIVGCKPRLARPSEVLEETGYLVDGVPPVALPSHVKLIID